MRSCRRGGSRRSCLDLCGSQFLSRPPRRKSRPISWSPERRLLAAGERTLRQQSRQQGRTTRRACVTHNSVSQPQLQQWRGREGRGQRAIIGRMGSSTKYFYFFVHRVLGFLCLRRDSSTAISCVTTFVPSSDNCCSCSFMLGSARRLTLAKGGRNLSVSSAKPSPCQQLSFHKRSWQATSRNETSRVSNYLNKNVNGARETRGGAVEVAGTHELRHRCLSTSAHQKMHPPPGEGVPRSAPGGSATAAAAVAAAAAAVIGAVAVASLAGAENAEERLGEGVKLSPLSARSTGPWPFLARPRVECAYRRKIQDMYHLVDSPVGQGEAAQSVWIYDESQRHKHSSTY